MNEEITEIERSAKTVSISPKARCIGQLACFNGCLTSLNIENTQITIIKKYAFAYCYELKEVIFPSSLEEICECAFLSCNLLSDIKFPSDSKLRIIRVNAFGKCPISNLTAFPPLLESIGLEAFYQDHINLRHTKVRHIDKESFYNNRFSCSKREEPYLILPPTISTESVYNNSMFIVEVDERHLLIKKDGCGCYFSNGTIMISTKNSKHVLIRRGVEIIARKCFRNVFNLVSVTIPASVIEIGEEAFNNCGELKLVSFAAGSRLKEIKSRAFGGCSFRKITFPKSLQSIRKKVFAYSELEQVTFPDDSQLKIMESPFSGTNIRHLSLPSLVEELDRITNECNSLESIFIKNEKFASNEDGTAIFSKDRSELFCVVPTVDKFEIPDSVRAIKRGCFLRSQVINYLKIPSSVEVIEDFAFQFCGYIDIIEFQEGSKLKKIGFNALGGSEDLIINNENFIKRDDGVVISLNPLGIVFVPKRLTELEIEEGVEVIYSSAFYKSNISSITLPKSIKKIYKSAFESAKLESVTFEEGTELDFLYSYSFADTNIKSIELPHIRDEVGRFVFGNSLECIEFPPNFDSSIFSKMALNCCYDIKKVICPRSSLPCVDLDHLWIQVSFEII